MQSILHCYCHENSSLIKLHTIQCRHFWSILFRMTTSNNSCCFNITVSLIHHTYFNHLHVMSLVYMHKKSISKWLMININMKIPLPKVCLYWKDTRYLCILFTTGTLLFQGKPCTRIVNVIDTSSCLSVTHNL